MDTRSRLRAIIVGLVGLGLIVLVIVLLVKSFSGHGGAPAKLVNVGNYANTSATATLLVDGPTNLDQIHSQLKITVSGTRNEMDLIQGYQGKVVKSQTYANNSAAFGAFLQSLQLLNFSKGRISKVDYRGFCPTGSRYLYSFNSGESDLFSYWSTSCGGQGTFEGNPAGVRALFEAQVLPIDLNTFAQNTNLQL